MSHIDAIKSVKKTSLLNLARFKNAPTAEALDKELSAAMSELAAAQKRLREHHTEKGTLVTTVVKISAPFTTQRKTYHREWSE